MLINDFFAIKKSTANEKEWVYRLSLNAGHPIFQAHFQGNPVTPGACIVQIIKELAEEHHSASFFIRSVKNVKFLYVINPLEHKEIDVHLTFKTYENNLFSVSAVIDRDKTVFCKLNLVLEKTCIDKKPALQAQMDHLKICVVIPTYNNIQTLIEVLNDILRFTNSVIVVNDGSTDGTSELLERLTGRIEVVSYKKNKGKGHALKCGFDRAEALGYKSVITLDSDGQHFANDVIAFVQMAETCPGAFLTGQRIVEGRMPSGNNFANKFSNFWFTVQTGRSLQDTQNGFRLYPLSAMKGMRPLSSRFEAELELLVRSAWKGIRILPVPVHVYYPPKEERVSHFRPGKDFLRISLLNTCLVILAVLYGYPSILCRYLFWNCCK
jgi:3-hydroxymyristoyl/3-hydroxydecanoyl-(acyl carrier protein) dehydratase